MNGYQCWRVPAKDVFVFVNYAAIVPAYFHCFSGKIIFWLKVFIYANSNKVHNGWRGNVLQQKMRKMKTRTFKSRPNIRPTYRRKNTPVPSSPLHSAVVTGINFARAFSPLLLPQSRPVNGILLVCLTQTSHYTLDGASYVSFWRGQCPFFTLVTLCLRVKTLRLFSRHQQHYKSV